MAYRLKGKDSSVEDGIRRIACEQIGKAIASIDGGEPAHAVHDVRKRCKKLRGLVRMVRPVLADYAEENAAFRDTAKLISAARDAKVMQDTYDALLAHYEGEIDRRALGAIRRSFTLRRKEEAGNGGLEEALAEVRARLEQARDRAASWQLADDGWKAVAGGFAKTYGRARKAASEAAECPNAENFHELRKRLKYHWYHCRLLENLWPEMLALRQHVGRDLSDILGDHHDLSVFVERLAADPLAHGGELPVEIAIGLAEGRKRMLEERGWPMVKRLLAQSPEALDEYFAALWTIWRKSRDGKNGMAA